MITDCEGQLVRLEGNKVEACMVALKNYNNKYGHNPLWIHIGLLSDIDVVLYLQSLGFEPESDDLYFPNEIWLGTN